MLINLAMSKQLTSEELSIIQDIENGQYTSVFDVDLEMKLLKKAARNYSKKASILKVTDK